MTLEVRYDDDEAVDEIVASGQIHLERLSAGRWCLIISTGKTRAQFSIGGRGRVDTTIVEIADDLTSPE